MGADPSSGQDANGDRSPGSARRLRRRRGLPGGRAVVGGFLVAAAAVGVFAAYLQATSGPERTWVVATADVGVGQRLEPEHLGLVAIDLPPGLEARALADPAEAVGAVTTAPLLRHDLLLATHLDDGSIASLDQMSFPIERASAVAGTLRPGDRVDVLASFRGDETEAVARDVLVLDVEASDGGLASGRDLVLTVALEPGTDALALAHAVSQADLHLVRVNARGASEQP